MRTRILILLTALLSCAYAAWSQEPIRPEIDVQQFVEELFQIQDEDVNYDDLYESLFQLYTNPIDLNNTNKNQLGTIFQLNINQINNLVSYIDQNKPLLSIYELQVIPDFDNQTIENIRPFMVVNGPNDNKAQGSLIKRITNEENTFLILRSSQVLEEKQGYIREDSGRYLGSPNQIYGRFQSSHSNDFSIGLTFEKDAGEMFTWDKEKAQYGFDYYSFHVYLQNKGNFKKISIGDYQMQFGQGLVLGSGFNAGKGSETITTVKRSNSGIRAYKSVLESGFMRGAAFTYSIHKNIDVSPFFSRIKQDANVQSTLENDGLDEFDGLLEYISSIQNTGFHRTYSELDNRDQITETNYGVNLTYNNSSNKNFEAGVTYIGTNYSTSIQKTANNYNQFEFRGDNNYNIGVFSNYNFQNFLLFGEAARSKSGGMAYIGGLMGSLSPIVSTSLVWRKYDKDYHTFYGNSFGEGSRVINEQGLYWGLKITPSRKYTISIFYDYFSFPWLKFRVEAPSDGYEYLARFTYKPYKKVNMYLQYRSQSKELTLSQEGQNIKNLEAGVKNTILGNLTFNVNPNIGLSSRVQYSDYTIDNVKTSGVTIVQDLNVKVSKFKISARFAIFDTDDYENRQYVYEKDLLYTFSIPAYSGVGTRNYLLLQYKPTRKITLWAKYGIYRFQDRDTVGSGNEAVLGNQRSELKFQIKYKI